MDIAWSLVFTAFASLMWGSYEMSLRASKKRIVRQIAFTKHRIREGRHAELDISQVARTTYNFLCNKVIKSGNHWAPLYLGRVEELMDRSILLLSQTQDMRDQIERETKYLKELEQQLDALQNREYTGKPI